MANVRIDVERTVRRRNSLQSEGGQGIEQQLAVAAVSLDVTLQLFTGIEGNQAGVLTQGGRREVHVAAEGTCPPGMLGSSQPSRQPTMLKYLEKLPRTKAPGSKRSMVCAGSV